MTNLLLHVSNGWLGHGLARTLDSSARLWRALLILPWAIPNYITALSWKTMFHVQYGTVNALLGAGGDPVELDWFGSFSTAFSNLITNTWLGAIHDGATLGALRPFTESLKRLPGDGVAGPAWTSGHCSSPR